MNAVVIKLNQKPSIVFMRLRDGPLWVCSLPNRFACGFGRTPLEAYRSWAESAFCRHV